MQKSDVPKKHSYPNCLGMFPLGMLEQCAIRNYLNHLHHPCQTEHEHSQNIDAGLHKHCFCCCARKMKEASESNSGKNMSQRNPSGRLKDNRAHNNESPTIHLRNSSAEDAGIADEKNLSQLKKPGTKESNMFDL